MRFKAGGRALVIALLGALAWTGAAPAVAQEQRGIDPNQGRSLVEVTLDSRAAAMRLQLQADRYGIEFNEHYLRRNRNGTVTATVFGYQDELDRLANAGYDIGATIEGPGTWREHTREYLQDRRQVARAGAAARKRTARAASHLDEIVILRVDYFENYAGRFLSVEAKTRRGGAAQTGSIYVGPDAVALLQPRRQHADRLPAAGHEHQHRPGHHAGHLHRAPRAGADRRGRHHRSAATVADPDRLEHRREQGGAGQHVAGRRPSADERALHPGLHDQLHGPDRDLRGVRGARGRVPEPRRADHPAQQDQRLSAPRPGDDGGDDGPGQHAHDGAAGRSGRPHVSCVGP